MNAVRTFMLGVVLVVGSVVAQASHHNEKDIVEVAVGAGSFETLVAAVQAADLVDALKGEGPFTVLAPTDEAFAKLPEGTLENLLKPENKKTLQSILLYHVIPVKAESKVVKTLSGAETLNGQRIDIVDKEEGLYVDAAKVVTADVKASNGVIHVIDSVILPSSKNLVEVATEAGMFNTLIAAAKAAGLVDPLVGEDDLTVFAPTDDAFAALPEGTVESLLKPENKDKLASILKLHILPGRVYSDKAVKEGTFESLSGQNLNIDVNDGKATVNGSGLIKTDIDASNGVVHVIDTVILP